LQAAAKALETAHATASAQAGEELVAAEIRHALDQLGTVVGTVYTDDILDKIFSRFCIGK
jgi:tRNA modification GTPase